MTAGTDIAAEVRAALAEAGTATGAGPLIATIRRRGAATGPPYAPTYGPDTLHTCTAVMGSYSAREREGTSIAATDVKVTASALDISPTAADILVIGGVAYEIVEATPLQPGGEVLLWEIQARK